MLSHPVQLPLHTREDQTQCIKHTAALQHPLNHLQHLLGVNPAPIRADTALLSQLGLLFNGENPNVHGCRERGLQELPLICRDVNVRERGF